MLNRRYLFGVIIAMTAVIISSAQEPSSDDTAIPANEQPTADAKPKKGTGKPGEAAAPPPPAPSLLPALESGDKIYMVSGTIMTGVQVIRSTPRYYEVQMIEGVEPIQIPRRQVKNVEYDDIDPAREKLRKQLFPEEEEVTIASGERVTGALRDKLMAPVSAEPLSYKELDFVKVLDEIKAKTATKLLIDPSIEQKPAGQRRWSVEIPPEKTLMALLREDLVGAFKYVEVIFEADSIIVMTKEAAKVREAAKTGAAGEAAPDAASVAPPVAPATPPPTGIPGRQPNPSSAVTP